MSLIVDRWGGRTPSTPIIQVIEEVVMMFLTLLLSAMLYGRGRKVLTLWGGSECSSSDSGVRAAGDTSLSSWPVLVLLALDRKRELEGRSQAEGERITE